MVNSQHDGVTERESLRRSGAGKDDVQVGDERRLFETGSSAERHFPFLRERLSRHKVDLRRYESFAPELVRFRPPAILSAEHSEFVVNIVVLDHRSLHAFGAHSRIRAEVKALLQRAVATAGYHPVGIEDSRPHGDGGDLLPATGLYRQAEEVFLRHLQARNRLRYLLGVTLGILVLVAVAFAVKAKLLPDALEDAIPLKDLPAIIFFAGLGSIVSVLLRLSKLDVMSESARVLVISGTGLPTRCISVRSGYLCRYS